MKIGNINERVRVMDARSDIWSVVTEIVNSNLQKDAFYVCNIGDIVRKHKLWKASLPRVEPYYAVGCNDTPIVLEVMAALGTGFNCATKSEINKMLSLGVDPNRVTFTSPIKTANLIRHAFAVGINTMTCDNEIELHKIKNLCPDAKVLLRVRYDDSAQCQLEIPLGCDPMSEAPQLLNIARDLGLEVIGLSHFVANGSLEPEMFKDSMSTSRQLFDYAASIGFQFSVLDLGHGLPGYGDTSVEKIADIISAVLDDFFPDHSVNIIAEIGQLYMASAFTLACNIHSIRTVATQDPVDGKPSNHFMYYINDGVFGSFSSTLYDHQNIIAQSLKEHCNGKLYSSSIWGPTCDGLDQVVEDIMLPEMNLGDWIIFENMGAYTFSATSAFNGFPVPQVHVVADESMCTLLTDILPKREEKISSNNTPSGLRLSMDMRDSTWAIPDLPINIQLPMCDEDSPYPGHIFDYVDIGPID